MAATARKRNPKLEVLDTEHRAWLSKYLFSGAHKDPNAIPRDIRTLWEMIQGEGSDPGSCALVREARRRERGE